MISKSLERYFDERPRQASWVIDAILADFCSMGRSGDLAAPIPAAMPALKDERDRAIVAMAPTGVRSVPNRSSPFGWRP